MNELVPVFMLIGWGKKRTVMFQSRSRYQEEEKSPLIF